MVDTERRIRIHSAATPQKCEGCGAMGALRSIDLATRPFYRKEDRETVLVPAGWVPLILLCSDCWAWVWEQNQTAP